MTEISIDLVKQLRDQTGVSIMQCKKALIEAEGDVEKAKIALTKRSGEIAAKKGDRELGAGTVVFEKGDSKAIILELACETDFVAKNEDFKTKASDIAKNILENNIENPLENEEIKTSLAEGTQKFGERMEISKFEVTSNENIGSYIHVNNSVGAIIEFSSEVSEEFGKDIAMHVAAQNPKYLNETDIDESERQKAEDTLREEVADKPAEMQGKILEGKMNSFFKERVLLTQGFIKDPSKSIKQLLDEKGVEIVKYTRFGVGEA